MGRINITELQEKLRTAGATWEAAPVEKKYRLGYTPHPSEDLKTLEIREKTASANLVYFQATKARTALPVTFDWRDVSGKSFVTPIRDQGSCGSCVSFGCVASVEAACLIQKQTLNQNFDLSEAHLFYCHTNAP